MQTIAAIHDGSSQGWETVYLAIHLAARLGASLLVLALPAGAAGSSISEQSEKIYTAAHAAGLQADIRAIDGSTPDDIIQFTGDAYVLMLPKDLAGRGDLVAELTRELACPIWVVTYKYEIRRLGAWLDPDAQGSALEYSTALANRLEQPLVLFAEHFPESTPTQPEVRLQALDEVSAAQLAEHVSQEHIDLLIFEAPQNSLFLQCMGLMDCILALCPPEQENALN